MTEVSEAPPQLEYEDIPQRENIQNFNYTIYHLANEQDRVEGSHLIRDGEIIGIQNNRVFAIMGDGNNRSTFNTLCQVKGEGRRGRQVALALPAEDIVKIVDLDRISPSLRTIFSDASQLTEYTRALYFWRFPIKASVREKWHDKYWLYSQTAEYGGLPMVQAWDPTGGGPIEDLTRRCIAEGVEAPLITSLNYTGSPEIVDWAKAAVFCERRGLKYLFKSHLVGAHSVGSYTTLTAVPYFGEQDTVDLELTRDGNTPADLIIKILERGLRTKLDVQVDPGQTKFDAINEPPKYEVGRTRYVSSRRVFPSNLVDGLSVKEAFEVLTLWGDETDPIKLNQALQRYNIKEPSQS